MDQRAQVREDKVTIQSLLDEGSDIVSQQHPERRTSVIEILERIRDAGARRGRGGPTKNMLLRLKDLVQGEFQTTIVSTKGAIVEELLNNLGDENANDNDGDNEVEDQDVALPEGWGDMINPTNTLPPTPLLRLRRNLVGDLPKEELISLLLDEQESATEAQVRNHGPTLRYVRRNLQEMAEKTVLLPPDTSDRVVWLLYQAAIQKAVNKVSTSEKRNEDSERVRPRRERRRDTVTLSDLISQSESDSDTDDSTTDSDLESYAPNRRFSLQNYSSKSIPKRKRQKQKSKRKHAARKRKRRKRMKKRKRRRKGREDTSSSSTSSASDDDAAPNGRRVLAAAYDATHYERLREFREGYERHTEDGVPDDWPTDEALAFVATKFARPRTLFADKQLGVKAKFSKGQQVRSARKKTNLIYQMSDEVAGLRIERNEQLAKACRRAKGASAAKKARIKQRASKYKRESVVAEQTLVAKIGVYCDLLLMGQKSWDAYHTELQLGGQREAVVESMGGEVSKMVAGKAWKAAQSSAVKANTKGPPNPRAPNKQRTCYWCCSSAHPGKFCADLNAGKSCNPSSRAAKWSKEEQKNAVNRRKRQKIKVDKP